MNKVQNAESKDLLEQLEALDSQPKVDGVLEDQNQANSEAGTNDPTGRLINTQMFELAAQTKEAAGTQKSPKQGSRSDDLYKSASHSPEEMKSIMQKAHKLNDLGKLQCDSAKEYMDKIAYHVPLEKLYEIVACCQFEEGAKFCPVLIKINDEDIIGASGGRPFLLQVWTEAGEMVFEKPLLTPPANWNISGDKLLFLEETNAREICLVKLFTDKKPILFKFRLPEDLTHGLVNSHYDHDAQNFLIQTEEENQSIGAQQSLMDVTVRSDTYLQSNVGRSTKKKNKNKHRHEDVQYMRAIGEINEDDYDASRNIDQASVSECFRGKELITRAPDKMISYYAGYIILAYRDNIFQFNVTKDRVDEKTSNDSKEPIVCQVGEDEIRLLDLSQSFKIVTIQPLGEITSIVLEQRKTRQMRFMRLEYNEEKNRISFIQLGVLVNQSQLTVSPLLKYRAICKIEDKSQKKYQIGVVLRENGRIEVYSDFILVNEYYNYELQCVDIATDFNEFYFKFVADSHLVTPEDAHQDNLTFRVRRVAHFWRNRISFNTSREISAKKWNAVIHKRISGYFALYSQILIFSQFLLVSHRNMISIYHMTKTDGSNVKQLGKSTVSVYENTEENEEEESSGQWLQTVSFDDGFIRKILIKKRSKAERISIMEAAMPKNRQIEDEQEVSKTNYIRKNLSVYQKFQIMGIIGTHNIRYIDLDHKGKMTIQNNKVKSPGRIIRFEDDMSFRNGTILLTDNVSDSDDYEKMDGSYLFTFPLQIDTSKNNSVTLYALKMTQCFELLKSETDKSCHYDSQFSIMRARRDVFKNTEKIDDCEITKHHDKRDFVNVLVCKSNMNNKTSIYPLLKERENPSSKIIKDMRLVMKEGNNRHIIKEEEDGSKLLEAFFVTAESFGDHRDHYAHITENSIKLYDKEMNIRIKFEGLNIKSCQQVHQSFIYTIQDNITHPPVVTKYFGENPGEPEPLEKFTFQTSGFYVYDIPQLFKGILEYYKLESSIGGQSSLVSKSKFGNRFTFLMNFQNIVVIPYPHMNLVECIGMGQKNEYVIWREKDGFFTALDRHGKLKTWSLVTGKMLYQEKQEKDGSATNIDSYEVYRADDEDITYTQNFYDFKQSSLSLLKSKVVISQELLDAQPGLKYNQPLLDRMTKKGMTKNKDGSVKRDKDVKALGNGLFKARDDKIEVRVRNSYQKSDIFHFKVMELKVHADTDDVSECRVRFHFFFELLRQKVRDKLDQFMWDVNSNPKQHLYLSKDTRRLMEVVNNYTATIYTRGNIDDEGKYIDEERDSMFDSGQNYEPDQGQQVKWKEEFRITRYPRFTEQMSVPVLFSPNFTYQFDINFRNENFTIIESKTRHIYMNIPSDLLSIYWEFLDKKQSVQLIASRFKWVDEKVFRIINQSNVDCLFEMVSTDPTDQDPSQRSLKLLSAVKIDNLRENQDTLDSDNLLVKRRTLDDENVFERLIRANQYFKTSHQHAVNTEKPNFKIQSLINKINYRRSWGGQDGIFDIELSFTWLDWRIIDLIIDPDVDVQLDDVDKDQRLQLCFDIFPKGRSALHYLAIYSQSADTYAIVRNLFKVANEERESNVIGADGEISFEVPILPDIYGQTPLDICLNIEKEADPKEYIEERPKEEGQIPENYAIAEEIFRGIKDYGYGHSSIFVTEPIIEAIRGNLSSVIDYLDTRLKEAEDAFRDDRTQRDIPKKLRLYCPGLEEYAAQPSQLWESDSLLKDKLFDPKLTKAPFSMQFLDTPYIYKPTEDGFEFIWALVESEVDLKIFSLSSVQIIIDRHQAFWKPFNVWGMGLPMIIQLIFFVWWSNIVITNIDESESFDTQNKIFQTLLTITAIYLLLLEITAIVRAKLDYLRDLTRLLNLITPALIMVNVYNTTDGPTETYFWTIQSWAGICIWLRFFLFLGTLDSFSFLIRLIVKSIDDMKYFLIVFFVGVFAFSDAFLSIREILKIKKEEAAVPAEGLTDYEKYFEGYVNELKLSFLTAFGGFDENLADYRNADWLVFILCIIFNMIVLLNLLIAIVSQTFADMLEAKVEEEYKEKARQIGLMQDSLFGFLVMQKEYDSNELLLIVKIMDKSDSEQVEVPDMVNALHEKVDNMQSDISQIKEQIEMLVNKGQ